MSKAAELTEGLSSQSYDHWLLFEGRLHKAIEEGHVREIPRLKVVWSRYERWFLEPATGDVYLISEADERPPWAWKKIDPLGEPEPKPSNNLRVEGLRLIEQGAISPEMARGLKDIFEMSDGLVETLGVSHLSGAERVETWYRECSTGRFYRLIQDAVQSEYRWDPVDEAEVRIALGNDPIN